MCNLFLLCYDASLINVYFNCYVLSKEVDIDIDIGTKHRLVAFKRPLILYIFRFTLQIHGHTGSQISVLIKIKFIFKKKYLIKVLSST